MKPSPSWIRRHWPFLTAVAFWLAVFVVTLARGIGLSGGRLSYASDDVYIRMAIAKNLVRHGVWGVTPHAFTSCASSIVWPILIAPTFVLFGVNVVVSWPYLRFESTRGFSDIRSMILRRDLESAESVPSRPFHCHASCSGETDFFSWHSIARTGLSNSNTVIYPEPGRLASFAFPLGTIWNKFNRNFDSGYFLFGGEPSWPTAALLFRSLRWIKKAAKVLRRAAAIPAWKFLLAAAIGAAGIFLLIRPMVWGTLLAGDPDWNLPARLLLDQTRALGIVLWIFICLGLFFASRRDLDGRSATILAVMISVSGFLLLTLSEVERSWRFWWFWPLQAIAVVATVEGLRRSWKVPARVSAAVCILAVGLYLPYRSAAAKVDSIARYGYGGRESGQIQALDWISAAAKADLKRTVTIGVARYHGEEDSTRPWDWLEFGLAYLDKTPNTVAGDIQPGDDYRVLEFPGADQDRHPVECPWEGYTPVRESRRFSKCRRIP
jgi:hypothetical protein